MNDEEDISRPEDWKQREIESLSIEQLTEYIAELRAEISRVELDIAAKKSYAGVAEALFKT